LISRTGSLSLLYAATLCTWAVAQNAPHVTADSLVDQLIENAAVYRATLPSLTAHETILSHDSGQLLLLKDAHYAQAEATMRVMRKTPDGPLEESRQITMLDGKPVPPDKHVVLPTGINGGFGGLSGVFFGGGNRHCFNFVLAPHPAPDTPYKLSITLRPESASTPHCPVKASEGMTATALVGADTHQLIHLEWTLPADFAAKSHHWPFSSVDLAPAKLGNETFWLPTEVIARKGTGKNNEEWIAHYSDYHRYTATSTIVPTSPNRNLRTK
jgi:hypothetical protein